LTDEAQSKIAMFCHVQPNHVVGIHDCSSVYAVPLLMQNQGLLDLLLNRFDITPPIDPNKSILLSKWRQLSSR
jgi:CTP synthase